MTPAEVKLPSRREISDALDGVGWRCILDTAQTTVTVPSLARAAEVAAALAAAVAEEPGAAGSLRMDLRADRVMLVLQSPTTDWVTPVELRLGRRLADAAAALGLRLDPGVGGPAPRAVQGVEIAIDALDIARVRPFWRAVMGYGDGPDRGHPPHDVLDPVDQGPSIWFQQMDEPRPQRNRIHLDVFVPPEVAPARIEAGLAAGGRLLSDAGAPAYWVLADPEGNEVCVCTWQGRD